MMSLVSSFAPQIFVAALIAALFYSLVFLILRGTLVIRGGLKLNLDVEARRNTMHNESDYPEFIAAIARSMLWYPVGECICVNAKRRGLRRFKQHIFCS